MFYAIPLPRKTIEKPDSDFLFESGVENLKPDLQNSGFGF